MLAAYRRVMNTTTTTPRESLGLRAVLVDSLPATLFTGDAPDRYTVEAVFSRKPERAEIDAILAAGTQEFLAQQGYPEARVSISDRRLEIAGTTLEELRDGLASALSDRLAQISSDVEDDRKRMVEHYRAASDREFERSSAVTALAQSISFTSRQPVGVGGDAAAVREWVDEGGSTRD